MPENIRGKKVIVAFIGDNSFGRELAAKEYIAGFVNVHGMMAIDRYIGEETDFAELSMSVSTLPFLSQRRLVVVQDFAANKLLNEKFVELVDIVADTTDLVIVESHVDGRSKYLANLKKLADVRHFTNLEGAALVAWVAEQANALGGSISRQVAEQLVDRVGPNQQQLSSELQKLVLYQANITAEAVNELTSQTPQSSIFAMLDVAFAGDTAKALMLYKDQRAQGMEPQAIFGMITWQLHILALVKTAGNIPPQEIATQAKISPFLVRKNSPNARRLSEAKLIKIYKQAIDTDKAMKTVAINADEAVQTLIFAFA